MSTIRLDWPQYRGGDPDGVMEFLPGLTRSEGRRAYGVGGQVAAMLAPDNLETVRIPVDPEGGDGRLAIGDARRTTFGSQSTNVFPLDADPPRTRIGQTEAALDIFITGMWIGHVAFWLFAVVVAAGVGTGIARALSLPALTAENVRRTS